MFLLPLRNLAKLTLSLTDLDSDSWKREERFLKKAEFVDIQEIELEIQGATDRTLEIISTKFPLLRELIIRDGKNQMSFDAMVKYLPMLKNLDLLSLHVSRDLENAEERIQKLLHKSVIVSCY